MSKGPPLMQPSTSTAANWAPASTEDSAALEGFAETEHVQATAHFEDGGVSLGSLAGISAGRRAYRVFSRCSKRGDLLMYGVLVVFTFVNRFREILKQGTLR